MDSPQPVKRHVLTKRTRRVLSFVGAAVALAAVIFVFGALSAPKSSAPTSSPGPAPQAMNEGQRIYANALTALQSGDTTAAIKLLEQAAAAGNADAKRKLAELRPGTSTGTGTPSPAAPPTDYDSAIADMRSLLPTAAAGYSLGLVETSTAGVIMPLNPLDTRSTQPVSVVVLTVFDKGTAAAASEYAARLPRGYPKDGAKVDVNGRSALFGTDGAHVAALSFARGRYAFDVVVTVQRGTPAEMKNTTIAIARAFPAARP